MEAIIFSKVMIDLYRNKTNIENKKLNGIMTLIFITIDVKNLSNQVRLGPKITYKEDEMYINRNFFAFLTLKFRFNISVKYSFLETKVT